MFPLSPAKIASIVGAQLEEVQTSWPALEAALAKHTDYSDNVAVAAIATVRVECPPFKPVHEYGTSSYFQRHYEGRADLGNTEPGDGERFAGRGFIQLTGRANYKTFGELLGVDLVANPDRALELDIAAEIFALFFKRHGCDAAANARDWIRVRQLVNGGKNALGLFLEEIHAESDALSAHTMLVSRILDNLPAAFAVALPLD